MAEDKTTLFRMPGGLMGELKCTQGVRAGESFSLSAGTFSIGRGAPFDLNLEEEPGVSKTHAKVIAENETYVLVDDESRNGTLLNGKPVTRSVLQHGDQIQICGCSLVFYSLGSTGVRSSELQTSSQFVPSGGPSQVPPFTEEGADAEDASALIVSDEDDDSDFYSDDLQVDEEDHDLKPVDQSDVGETVTENADPSVTVAAGMVADEVDPLEMTRPLDRDALVQMEQEYRAPQQSAPTEAPSAAPKPMPAAAPKPRSVPVVQKSNGGRNSFLAGLGLVLVGYAGWVLLPPDEVALLFSEETEATESPGPDEAAQNAPKGQTPPAAKAEEFAWVDVVRSRPQGPVFRAPSSGVVRELKVTENSEVIKGQELLVIVNGRLSSDIETVKLSIRSLEDLAKTSKSPAVVETLQEERAKLAQLQNQQRIVFKATKSGTISSLKVKAGSSVRKGSVLASLKGAASPLRFKLDSEQAKPFKKGASIELKKKSGDIATGKVTGREVTAQATFLTLKSSAGLRGVVAIRPLKNSAE